jgi:hypothetical protein
MSTSTEIRRCSECGCTDLRACRGGCFWVAPNLCSKCLEYTAAKILGIPGYERRTSTTTSHGSGLNARNIFVGVAFVLGVFLIVDRLFQAAWLLRQWIFG